MLSARLASNNRFEPTANQRDLYNRTTQAAAQAERCAATELEKGK
jgi:hypothetical protein